MTDDTIQHHWQGLLKRLVAVLELVPTRAYRIRLRKRHGTLREQMLMFTSDREVPPPNNVSEQVLCMSAVFRKMTNGFRAE